MKIFQKWINQLFPEVRDSERRREGSLLVNGQQGIPEVMKLFKVLWQICKVTHVITLHRTKYTKTERDEEEAKEEDRVR